MADVRDDIAKGLEGKFSPEQIEFLMSEVLAIRKKVWVDFACKKCGQKQRQLAEIPDAVNVTKATTELINQAYGRPAQAEGDADSEKITFIREVRK